MKALFPSRGRLDSNLRRPFSFADLIVVPLIFCAILLFTKAFEGASTHFDTTSPNLTVSLDPRNLPYYGLRTMARMFVAVIASLLFTLVYATLAAKSRRAEKILIPALDFLQSLPILGFLTVTTTIFLGVFRGSLLGLEAASIFAIFTSQVWNMTFSFYHSLITVPRDLIEASAMARQSRWHRFWSLEVPFAMPGLVWNTMMSVSGGWFFVVASEVITVVGRNDSQALPGVGSYIARAIDEANKGAMIWAAATLLILILLYDQLIFRPIVAWSEKFKVEQSESSERASSWMLTVLRRSRMAGWVAEIPNPLVEWVSQKTASGNRTGRPIESQAERRRRVQVLDTIWMITILVAGAILVGILANYMFGPGFGIRGEEILAANPNLNQALDPEVAAQFRAADVVVGTDKTVYLSNVCEASANGSESSTALTDALQTPGIDRPGDLVTACSVARVPAGKVSWSDAGEVALRGVATMLRVVVLIVLATLVWTPIGVWIGLRPRAAQIAQPFAQFAAAFPANLVFPVAVVIISRLALSPNIFLSPLMILGTQWYILFNVIAGTLGIPNDLKEATRILGLKGWLAWRTLIIPAIFPAFVTGGITASGGSWNASIVAEVASWGSTTLVAFGLGSYIAQWSTGAFNPHVALGMFAMGMLVLAFNRLLWRPLYHLAETRFRLD
ncbi:MAG: ABC transporter permease subunit [Thermomicrobiales bacterium]